MKSAITVLQMTIRGAGVIQILLGLAFWTGNLLTLVPIHMLVGLVLVLALIILAILAARSGVNLGLVALAIVWALIVPVLGVTQAQLLPGAFHWVIEVVHLLAGLGAMALGDRLAVMSKENREAVLST
jgi:hypothetical protein